MRYARLLLACLSVGLIAGAVRAADSSDSSSSSSESKTKQKSHHATDSHTFHGKVVKVDAGYLLVESKGVHRSRTKEVKLTPHTAIVGTLAHGRTVTVTYNHGTASRVEVEGDT
jgi:hypothetical protein